MRQPPAHVWRGRLVPAWTAALVLAAGALALASPAAAHDALVGTDPADGAVLDEAPTQVVLTFAAEQAGVGAEVVVTGPDGTSWSDGAPAVSGRTVTQPLTGGMPDGAYTVAWRSVAGDGHPVTGAFTFDLDAPDAEGESDAPTAEETAADEATPDETAPGPTEDATAEGQDDGGEPSDSGGWTGWHTAGAALAVVLATAAAYAVRRSRRG